MARAKKNKSEEITNNDGRKNNKRLAPKPISGRGALPSRSNKAKRDRISTYGISAMKAEYGSEKEFFEFLAKQARKSYSHMKLFMEYCYGKPASEIDSSPVKKNTTPIINFINNEAPKVDNPIDITPKE